MFFHRKKLLGRSLKILLVTNGLILTAAAMLGPIYALFVEEIGGSLLDASYAGAIFALAAGITVLVSGKYADRIKRPEFIVAFGYAMVGLGFLLLTIVNSIWSLLLVQALIGFGEATYSPSFDAIYSRHLNKHKEGKQWGVWESMFYFTSVIGALAGGLIATHYNFDVLFIIMATMCLASAIYIFFLPKKVL
jgi:DHA1 family tetracycline resistance protein-like MFS transporter